jgi:hypothetical protein
MLLLRWQHPGVQKQQRQRSTLHSMKEKHHNHV